MKTTLAICFLVLFARLGAAAVPEPPEMFTKVWKVTTNEYERLLLKVDLRDIDSLDRNSMSSVDFLGKAAGVSFPNGAGVLYVPASGRLILHNTRSNLRKADAVISSVLKRPKEIR
jgi:hypothetical protein